VAVNSLLPSNNLKRTISFPKLFIPPSSILQKTWWHTWPGLSQSSLLVAVVVMSALPTIVGGRSREDGNLGVQVGSRASCLRDLLGRGGSNCI
jgi:hypothetical protein